jgi:hypothetical protein
MKIRNIVVALAAVGASALALAPSAQAATSGTEYFEITIANTAEAATTHGLFADGGWDESGNTNYDVLHLSNGDLRITHPDSKITFQKFALNPDTCAASLTIRGGYTLGHGTGAYAGITGHGTYNARIHLVADRVDGVCDQNSAPLAETGIIRGNGPAFLPGGTV